jgi:hypothetical protein
VRRGFPYRRIASPSPLLSGSSPPASSSARPVSALRPGVPRPCPGSRSRPPPDRGASPAGAGLGSPPRSPPGLLGAGAPRSPGAAPGSGATSQPGMSGTSLRRISAVRTLACSDYIARRPPSSSPHGRSTLPPPPRGRPPAPRELRSLSSRRVCPEIFSPLQDVPRIAEIRLPRDRGRAPTLGAIAIRPPSCGWPRHRARASLTTNSVQLGLKVAAPARKT